MSIIFPRLVPKAFLIDFEEEPRGRLVTNRLFSS